MTRVDNDRARGAGYRIGVGLPAAIPGAPGRSTVEWASLGEKLGFASLGVIDRLVYDNLDPLVALSAAAAVTDHVELFTTVLNVPWRQSALTLAKLLDRDEANAQASPARQPARSPTSGCLTSRRWRGLRRSTASGRSGTSG